MCEDHHLLHKASNPRRVEEEEEISCAHKSHNHNVNSLFTLGIFIDLSFNLNDPFNTLNINPSCIPTTDIAENLVVAVQYLGCLFLRLDLF
ncbi:hypothetical protein MTR_7g112930 [Medicago truncatula]|uniref:Uncharacterized protein n=1 Tax=Medicago truncatula TaxID=3880 RepID=G7KXL6_MEDTR|nr:hypothetical protein MTR_7g112930 [Medicago truncatula]